MSAGDLLEFRHRYVSLEDFRRAIPARRTSAEADYGVGWRSTDPIRDPFALVDWPVWVVSYVQDTGEVIAVQQTGSHPVEVLGSVPADWQYDPAKVSPDTRWYATLDAVLDGWEHPDVTGWDLGWVRDRLDAYAQVGAP